PKYFAAAPLDHSSQGVRFRLPKDYHDKETVGLNNPWRNQGKWKTGKLIELDDQHFFKSGLSYVGARQKAIELVLGLLGILMVSGHGMTIGAYPCTGLTLQTPGVPPFWRMTVVVCMMETVVTCPQGWHSVLNI
ncbi:MAG: hypothetical protein ACKPKO_48625, partial [Candidatus Fonsibacter sp.]